MTAKPKVICCGSVVLDFVFHVGAIPPRPVKVLANSFREGGGGLAATAAVMIAALGEDVVFWGRAGADVQGDQLLRLLQEAGVRPLLHRPEGSRTPTSAILVDDAGERLAATFRGERLGDDVSWLPLSDIGAASAVLCDVRWVSGAAAVLAEARRRGVPGVLDADLASAEDLQRLVPLSDYALFSHAGLSLLTGTSEPEEALRRVSAMTEGLVGVTLGELGFLWMEGGTCCHQPVFAVQAVETNGAGDAFHGGYALAVAGGASPRQAARFAGAVAAAKCSRQGGWQSAPTQAAIQSLLRQYPEEFQNAAIAGETDT